MSTLPRRISVAIAAVLVLASCSGSDRSTSENEPTGTDATPTDATSTDAAAEDTGTVSDDTVEVPGLTDDPCGRPDHPCDWTDAPEAVFDRAFALGEAAMDDIVAGASVRDVAVRLAAEDGMVTVFTDLDTIVFRMADGPEMWVAATMGPEDTKGAPSASARPSSRTSSPAPAHLAPRDVVGDSPVSKRALVVAPYLWEFGENDDALAVADLYRSARGYEGNVSVIANSDNDLQVNRDAFTGWEAYDVIHVSTHGTQLCDASGCQTVLLMDRQYISKEVLYDEDGGSTVVFTRAGPQLGVSDRRLAQLYPDGLPNTVIVFSACDTGKGTELTDLFGGVTFSWTEPVRVGFAARSSIELHRTLIEYGTTTERAHQVVGDAGLVQYERPAPPSSNDPTGPTTYLVMPSGELVPVGSGEVGGEGASSGGGPEIEVIEGVAPDEPTAESTTVELVRRGGGDGDLRVREVAWVEHPERAVELSPGDEVRVRIGPDADHLPVRLRVEGIDEGDEASTTVRLEVNGVELDRWPLSTGEPTGRWGEWVITEEVPLMNRIEELDIVDLRMVVDLPEGGTSEHSVNDVRLTCLVGMWRIREQNFLDQMASYGASSVPGGFSITYTGGRFMMEIRADGTLTDYRDAFQFRTTTSAGSSYTTLTSEDPGTWTTSDGVLTVVMGPSSAVVEFEVEIDGRRMPLPYAGTHNVDVPGFDGATRYRCEDRTLTLEADGAQVTFDLVED